MCSTRRNVTHLLSYYNTFYAHNNIYCKFQRIGVWGYIDYVVLWFGVFEKVDHYKYLGKYAYSICFHAEH